MKRIINIGGTQQKQLPPFYYYYHPIIATIAHGCCSSMMMHTIDIEKVKIKKKKDLKKLKERIFSDLSLGLKEWKVRRGWKWW
jgi:hypothetical protein